MAMFRVERNVTVVQFAYVQADSAEDAQRVAEDDPQLIEWRESSVNDPVVVDVYRSDPCR